ncbi:MAG: ThiF family adenylyltransferase [Myxococcales bacterium]|nr:ThiF family adenylyltransferase [Myxococcales bacterium]
MNNPLQQHLARIKKRSMAPLGTILVPPDIEDVLMGENPPPLFAYVTNESFPRWTLTTDEVGGTTIPIAIGTQFCNDDQTPVLQPRTGGLDPLASFQGRRLGVCFLNPNRYRDRVRALPTMDLLLSTRVLLVGCGSVGSDIGARLVRLGASVVACDADVLSVENLIRWGVSAGIAEIGLPKVDVWANHLCAIVPDAKVRGVVNDVVTQTDEFEQLLVDFRPGLVIAATDTLDSRLVINGLCARHKIAALYVALSDGAQSARIELVPNAQAGPCHWCSSKAEGDVAPKFGAGTLIPYAADVAKTAVSALPINVGIASAWAARIAVAFLSQFKIETEPPVPSPELWSEYFIHGKQQGTILFMALEPDTWVFENPMDRVIYQPIRADDCPVCGGGP